MSNLKQKIANPLQQRRIDHSELIANTLWHAERRHQPTRRRIGWVLLSALLILISNTVAVIYFSA